MKADQGGVNGGQPVNAVHMPSECRTVIRRGVKSSLLLADGAKVFAPPEGRKSLSSVYSMRSTTYTSLAERDACLHSSTPAAPEEMDAFPEASFVVRSHDQFISYSWNGSRRGKWWSLLYLHNFSRAIVAMILALATCLAVLFVLMDARGYRPNLHNLGLAMVLAVPLVVFFVGHNLPCASPKTVFLDRLCISQTDAQLRHEGILSIGCILQRSSSLCVLWSRDYFERLWCVYEIATFLCRCDQKEDRAPARIEIVFPTQGIILVTVLLAYILNFVIMAVTACFTNSLGCSPLEIAVNQTALVFELPCVIALGMLHFARERLLIQRQLRDFDIRRVKCTDPDDRPLVEANIRHEVDRGQRFSQLPGIGKRDQLDVFNELVRTELARDVLKANGAAFEVYPAKVLAVVIVLQLYMKILEIWFPLPLVDEFEPMQRDGVVDGGWGGPEIWSCDAWRVVTPADPLEAARLRLVPEVAILRFLSNLSESLLMDLLAPL